MEQRFVGQGLGFGKQLGQAQLYPLTTLQVPCYTIQPENISGEMLRFRDAVASARRQLLEQKQRVSAIYGPTLAEVFDVQLELLADDYLHHQVEQQVKHTLKNVEFCVQLTTEKCLTQVPEEQKLELRDIETQLLRHLLNKEASYEGILHKIIVTHSLTLSDVLYFDKHTIAGIILEENCATAHATILAKQLRVPLVIGIKDACQMIQTGDDVLLDGNTGVVVVHPEFHEIASQPQPKASQRAQTEDGVVVYFEAVYAPYVTGKDLQESGAAGIGLVRTEALFLNATDWPDEETQFQRYRSILQDNAAYPVVFRAWDVGGDKKIYGQEAHESNPFLGQRALRYCLQHPAILKIQFRALLRASRFGHAKLLYPFVTGAEEVKQANLLLQECQAELEVEGVTFQQRLELGVMLEIPSTAFILDQLSAYASFFSIGSNDWVQYLLAADRTNSQISSIKNMTHPAVLRSLKKMIGHAEQLLTPVHLCGEAANHPVPFLMCLGLGFRCFICDLGQNETLKKLVTLVNLQELKALTSEAYFLQTKESIWTLFENYFSKIFEQNEKK